MSINIVVTKDGTQLSSGAQYIYTRGILYPKSGDPIEFDRTPLDKQSGQYAYTNENPVSLVAQRLTGMTESQFKSGVNAVMLMSGARNSVETKIFFGPRNFDCDRMILFDEVSQVQVEFSGEEFENLLNDDTSKFISIVYTRSSEGDSFELDLHTDANTYSNATDYSSLDYSGLSNYPHFNQLKYSNRLVSNDDFITSSMSINSTIKYNPNFGNYYIRPDFVKAFKGFKIIGKTGESLSIQSSLDIIWDDDSSYGYVILTALTDNLYYEGLYWDYSPKIPGIDLVPINDAQVRLIIDPDILHDYDLCTSTIDVYVYSNQRLSAKKSINIYEQYPKGDTNTVAYVANPNLDPNKWYDITEYLKIEDAFRMRADSYSMSTNSEFIELDQSNYRFRLKGNFNLYNNDGVINWLYKPSGSNQEFTTSVSVIKSNDPITRSSGSDIEPSVMDNWVGDSNNNLGDTNDIVSDTPSESSGSVLYCKFKVLKWIKCKDSTIDISNLSDHYCNLSSDSGIISIKAVTLHGIYLYREVL